MQRKVKTVSRRLAEILSGWEGIQAILLGEAAEIETLDPYFDINLDVYQDGNLLPVSDRREQFRNPTTFETFPVYPEDRFLMEDLPVRIRYHDTNRFDLILSRINNRLWVYRSSSTNMFYRLQKSQVLHQGGSWLEKIREKLANLPDHFWQDILDSTRISVNYYFNDLNAAVYRQDSLFYLFSASSFIRSVCSFLFALNRSFEPAGRMLYKQVTNLTQLPDEFLGRFESFLREEPELTLERKREIAELLTRSIISMK